MNLHEYQAKQLFIKYGIPTPVGYTATTRNEAKEAANKIGGELWVVKAQAHTGGRGKAGGVKIAKSITEVQDFTEEMMGMTLVTHQTGPIGLPVNIVYIEPGSDIDREIYLSILLDREEEKISFVASAAGGMNIEEVAEKYPEKIFKISISSASGLMDYQIRQLAFGIGLYGDQLKQFALILKRMYALFKESDASLIEINPLIVSRAGKVIALDAKINIDSNALYRQKEIIKYRDPSQEDAKENEAAEKELNYVSLDGNIACMVNGAGLAMATMDLIKLHGGEPANFLDVGGGATSDRVAFAFKLILSNTNVRAILVNIFGGIVRCDLIAQGVISAIKEVGVNVPVIVRLEGTNVKKGRALLKESELEVITASDLTDAAKKAVAVAVKS
ncbi:MAG: ADP-forming succinate--CoA ligase subunit beta [Woeseiaceae bacterium]|jgi:succinyl-CoA synthetase beta subunit|nr:ADP-forming succinate--CoA ligase subunit beta [Woeseiaceae bacterium]MDG1016674.1 ADP-forming succinate--CoA ligase subunit beta [Woeseiaceae bacterium]MDG1865317.1 ADP-forming succinate--CoA ligase subunit beta [Woeseiaceae bacterium]